MKLARPLGEAVMASAGTVSMFSLLANVVPAPFSTIVFGGGAGLLTASVLATQRKKGDKGEKGEKGVTDELVGEVGALPGVPNGKSVKARATPKRSQEKDKLLRQYDRAFAQMLSRHGDASRSELMEKMRPILYELSADIRAWTGDTRIRIYMLMQQISKGLDDPETAKSGLGLLVLILSRGGNSALEMARPLFHERIQNMYLDPRYENEQFVPRLLLMLDDYDVKKVETLTKEAIHVWPDKRFSAARDYLGFEELAERGLRKNIKGMLGSEIAKAGINGDRTALDRAVELYHEVR